MLGFSIFYDADKKTNVHRWIRIAIDWRLFVGICFEIEKEFTAKEQQALKNDYADFEYSSNAYWSNWDLIPNEDACPNFKEFNEAYLELFDNQKFDIFV